MTRINDNGIDRDMSPAEKADYEAWAASALQEQFEHAAALEDAVAAKASARAKLKALGLTDAEVAALVG